MAILDQISQMKQEGLSETEITTRLQEQGITPKAITDAFSQAKIKDAVAGEQEMQTNTMAEDVYTPQPDLGINNPMVQDTSQMNQQYAAPQGQQYYGDQYAQGGYDQGYAQGGYASMGTDTMIEVAEQVFEEKTRKMQKQVDSLVEMSKLSETKIDNFEERLKRIENMIDKLQISILEKVGSYGEGIESVKNELSMIEDSFAKVVPEIVKKNKKSTKK